jgi:hypothetical protein
MRVKPDTSSDDQVAVITGEHSALSMARGVIARAGGRSLKCERLATYWPAALIAICAAFNRNFHSCFVSSLVQGGVAMPT